MLGINAERQFYVIQTQFIFPEKVRISCADRYRFDWITIGR
jgi:hypothetical protein